MQDFPCLKRIIRPVCERRGFDTYRVLEIHPSQLREELCPEKPPTSRCEMGISIARIVIQVKRDHSGFHKPKELHRPFAMGHKSVPRIKTKPEVRMVMATEYLLQMVDPAAKSFPDIGQHILHSNFEVILLAVAEQDFVAPG